MAYKRILIKLSGEALGENGKLFDFGTIDQVASALSRISKEGVQVALVIGAGNIWRGRQGAAKNIAPVNADHMGMLATVVNCIAMQDALVRAGSNACVLSAIEMNRICEPYTHRSAIAHLEAGDIVVFAGGTGNPFFSTDTAAALRAVEIGADAILLAKNIDGVYDSDPRLNPDAKFLKDITYQEVLERDLKVMDGSAITICRDNHMPSIRVFALERPDNLLDVIHGMDVGTTVHP